MFPARERLVSECSAWDGKTNNLFLLYSVLSVTSSVTCIYVNIFLSFLHCVSLHFLLKNAFFIYLSLPFCLCHGQYCMPLAWSFNLSLFYILVSSIFSSVLVCYSCLYLPVFLCLSSAFLSLSAGVAFSCLFIFVFSIFSSAFYLYPPLSIVLLFYDWPLFVTLQNNAVHVFAAWTPGGN